VDFSGFMNSIVSFAQNHTVIVIVLALVLLYFIYRRPKIIIGILVLCLLLAGLLYLITSIAGSGSKQEKKLMHEEGKEVDTNR
jgi:lipopolysaccharide export LptBFGC system permease protein LptF